MREIEQEAGAWGWIFWRLRTISYFTYEMVKNQGKIATEGNFRKYGQDARCFRPVRHDIICPFH